MLRTSYLRPAYVQCSFSASRRRGEATSPWVGDSGGSAERKRRPISMMRDDVDFCIELIKEVQNNPCLYDTESPYYNNSMKIQVAWKNIGSKVGENGLNCRRKWKIIRSSFLRSLHNVSKTGGAKKDYYLSSYLDFLRPFIKMSPRDEASAASDDDAWSEPKEYGHDRSSDGDYEDSRGEPADLVAKRKRVDDLDPVVFVGVKREVGAADEGPPKRDPCEMYLLSLVPHLRSMDLRQQLQFQQGVIDLIEKIKYGH